MSTSVTPTSSPLSGADSAIEKVRLEFGTSRSRRSVDHRQQSVLEVTLQRNLDDGNIGDFDEKLMVLASRLQGVEPSNPLHVNLVVSQDVMQLAPVDEVMYTLLREECLKGWGTLTLSMPQEKLEGKREPPASGQLSEVLLAGKNIVYRASTHSSARNAPGQDCLANVPWPWYSAESLSLFGVQTLEIAAGITFAVYLELICNASTSNNKHREHQEFSLRVYNLAYQRLSVPQSLPMNRLRSLDASLGPSANWYRVLTVATRCEQLTSLKLNLLSYPLRFDANILGNIKALRNFSIVCNLNNADAAGIFRLVGARTDLAIRIFAELRELVGRRGEVMEPRIKVVNIQGMVKQ